MSETKIETQGIVGIRFTEIDAIEFEIIEPQKDRENRYFQVGYITVPCYASLKNDGFLCGIGEEDCGEYVFYAQSYDLACSYLSKEAAYMTYYDQQRLFIIDIENKTLCFNEGLQKSIAKQWAEEYFDERGRGDEDIPVCFERFESLIGDVWDDLQAERDEAEEESKRQAESDYNNYRRIGM